jgi:hypothetical protein
MGGFTKWSITIWQNQHFSSYHDHGITVRNLYCGFKYHLQGTFRVIEHDVSKFFPKTLPLGKYQLFAFYLDRANRQIKRLNSQNLIDRGNIERSPPLNLVYRISQLAAELQHAILEYIFEQINNFN